MSAVDSLAPPTDYLKTYSLRCEPFASTLDGRFFYAGPALMQRLDLLTHLTQFGEAVILVSGPQGSGKTTLLGRFVAQTGKQWRLCLINADEFGQFRQRLGDALGIAEAGEAQQMIDQWAGQHDAAQLLVIVIDNAQLLPPDAVQHLCALLTSPQGDRLRLILFGTPDAQQALKQTLDGGQLPCTAQLLEIPKLSEEETASYLLYRLAVAGYSGESPFNATEVRAICKAADGRPDAINRLAHESLLEHQRRATSKRLKIGRPGWRINRGVLGIASLLVIGVAVYLGWQRLQPEPTPGATAGREQVAAQALPLPLPAPVTKPEAEPETLQPPAPRPALPDPDREPPPAPADSSPAAATPREQAADIPQADAPARGPVVAAQPSPPAPRAATASTDSNRVDGAPLAAAQAPERDDQERAAPAAAPASPADTPGDSQPSGTAQPPVESAGPGEPAGQSADNTPAPPVAPEPAAPPAAGTPPLPHREDWLMQQPPDQYSLQLLGSRQESSMHQYIRQNGLDPELSAYYQGRFQGGDWYVLIYGLYTDRRSALEARDGLPAGVRKEKPWPRSLESVHTAIRAAR